MKSQNGPRTECFGWCTGGCWLTQAITPWLNEENFDATSFCLFPFSFTPKLNHGKKTPRFSHFLKCGGSFPQGPTLGRELNSGFRKNPCPKLLSLHVTHFGVIKHWRNSQSVFGGHFSCVNIPPMIEKGILHAYRSGRNLTPTNRCEKNLVCSLIA